MSLHLGKDFLKSLHPHLLKSDKKTFQQLLHCYQTLLLPANFLTVSALGEFGQSSKLQELLPSLSTCVVETNKYEDHLSLDGNLDVLDKGDIRVEHEGCVVIGETPLPVGIFPLWCVRLLVPTQGGVHQALIH